MKQRTSITRTRWPLILLAILIPILCSAVFAATVGDQVELKATHQAGVPLHQELHGTNDFQRIPDGTRARVIDIANNGQWLKLSLPDGRTGWVTSRYVSSLTTGTPSTSTSPTEKNRNVLRKAPSLMSPTATQSP